MSQQPRHRQMASRSVRLARSLTLVVLLAVSTYSLSGFSSATFTSRSATDIGTITAAADWTPPTVSIQSPGASATGTVTLNATASDGESGINNVVIQYQPAEGASWTTVCTDNTTPYSCSWNTTAVADGAYDLRAVATDNANYSTTSTTVRTTVANKLTVVLTDPGDVVKGNVILTSNVYNGGLIRYPNRVEYAVAGTTNWKTACTYALLSTDCTWSTAGIANGFYDLRAVASGVGTSYYSAVNTDILVDNTAPTVTMIDPGTPLSGTRTFAATATDADSGVARVVVEYALSGSSAFKTLCTIIDAPFSCRYATTALANGTYSFRAIATDVAGSTTTSTAITGRIVDNTPASVSVEDPGQYLSGAVTIAANANSTAGISSVRIQRAPTGATTWTDICTDTTSPYSCSFNTTAVSDGNYDLRAILLDGTGTTTTSSVVSARTVDNSVVRAIDVQATNGGGTAGKLDNGDKLTYTYSELINPTSLLAGWDGNATAVSLRLRDGNTLGLGNTGDSIDVLKGSTSVNLGSVILNGDFIKSNKTAIFNATMTASTTSDADATVRWMVIRLITSDHVVPRAASGPKRRRPARPLLALSPGEC